MNKQALLNHLDDMVKGFQEAGPGVEELSQVELGALEAAKEMFEMLVTYNEDYFGVKMTLNFLDGFIRSSNFS